MEVHDYLIQLLAILVAARLFGEIATVFGAPSVIGELLAGIIIGPSLLGWVDSNEFIIILAEIGVILLLFEVGLETDFNKLMDAGGKAIVVALGGFFAPLIIGFCAAHYLFELDYLVSLFIGGTLTATSIGITVRTLSDVGKQNSREGQITLGAAVLDDVLGVILLALLFEFSVKGEVNWVNTGKVLLYVGIFFMLAPILAKLMSQVIKRLDQRIENPGLIPTTIVALVLFFAWLAYWFGAPELLGGFAAGIALSRRFFLPFGLAIQTDHEFSERIEQQMKPIVQLFTPIFFVAVGLSLDLSAVDWGSLFFWGFSLTLVALAICTKFTGALLIDEPLPRRIVIGMAMVPRGEVGLIFAGLGKAAGVFDDGTYTALVMVIVYTTLLSPFWIKLYYRMFGKHLTEKEPVKQKSVV
ncbi:cation:proton antiporter [Amphritea balenae]|uniref:Cation:proton antiporter n=1 Tax=Amphritea balenae TaxID=452629 RepID=A0A3P1SIC5_9GAMM|nr:cation:proton antiporter [Amphritea balenae]RRC97033.1 cation:proton antiporter [Amphritea balenae]GGK67462.1 sodium:proton antiporter [Amphritea balenae]